MSRKMRVDASDGGIDKPQSPDRAIPNAEICCAPLRGRCGILVALAPPPLTISSDIILRRAIGDRCEILEPLYHIVILFES